MAKRTGTDSDEGQLFSVLNLKYFATSFGSQIQDLGGGETRQAPSAPAGETAAAGSTVVPCTGCCRGTAEA